MRAMVLTQPGKPLELQEIDKPQPGPGQLLIKVLACGVCRTDLHIADGELTHASLPLVPGHEVVGQIVTVGKSENPFRFQVGERVGVPWLGWTCGRCHYCRIGQENLCGQGRFTGYHQNGGYAEYCVADERYCFRLPPDLDHAHAAPLLCAGLIGYRAYSMVCEVHRLGLYGFGAAAHILTQIAVQQGKEVYAFTRPEDQTGQQFALSLGASWAGGSDQVPPSPLDAAILFAPVGELVPRALKAVQRGGKVICSGIHMSDIPSFPYSLLWHERSIESVANLTRRDGVDFFQTLQSVEIKTEVSTYPLEQANQALADLREGRLQGAAVLVIRQED